MKGFIFNFCFLFLLAYLCYASIEKKKNNGSGMLSSTYEKGNALHNADSKEEEEELKELEELVINLEIAKPEDREEDNEKNYSAKNVNNDEVLRSEMDDLNESENSEALQQQEEGLANEQFLSFEEVDAKRKEKGYGSLNRMLHNISNNEPNEMNEKENEKTEEEAVTQTKGGHNSTEHETSQEDEHQLNAKVSDVYRKHLLKEKEKTGSNKDDVLIDRLNKQERGAPEVEKGTNVMKEHEETSSATPNPYVDYAKETETSSEYDKEVKKEQPSPPLPKKPIQKTIKELFDLYNALKNLNVDKLASEDNSNSNKSSSSASTTSDKEPVQEEMVKSLHAVPTFFVPGLGGSTLIAEYRNAYIPSCGSETLNSHPFRLWISISRLLSLKSNIYCLIDTLKLKYNTKDRKYYNQKGVAISVEEYGHLKGINYMDYFGNIGINGTKYFAELSHYFISRGYVNSENLLGAPYDWRLPIHQQNYTLFKGFIEYTYEKENKKKVSLVGHSLGCLFINYFLNNSVNNAWKKKYLNGVIYVNGPFKGSMKAVRALVHGNGDFISLNVLDVARFQIPDALMKTLNTSLGSLLDLIPYPEYYEKDQIVIIINMGEKPLTKKEMDHLIRTCGLYNTSSYTKHALYKLKVYTLSTWTTLLSPEMQQRIEDAKVSKNRHFQKNHEIPIFCVSGLLTTMDTEQVIFFQSPDITDEPYIFYGAGDGSVNVESLNACHSFYNMESSKVFVDHGHLNILHKHDPVKYIYQLATTEHKAYKKV